MHMSLMSVFCIPDIGFTYSFAYSAYLLHFVFVYSAYYSAYFVHEKRVYAYFAYYLHVILHILHIIVHILHIFLNIPKMQEVEVEGESGEDSSSSTSSCAVEKESARLDIKNGAA
jgi:hypothetical protein